MSCFARPQNTPGIAQSPSCSRGWVSTVLAVSNCFDQPAPAPSLRTKKVASFLACHRRRSNLKPQRRWLHFKECLMQFFKLSKPAANDPKVETYNRINL